MNRTEEAIEEMTDHLQLIKNDLIWQLSFEKVDWNHFRETVKSAEILQSNVEKCRKSLVKEVVFEEVE